MLQTKYITLDDFKAFSGIDLREELGTEEKACAFLVRLETRLASYCDANFNKNVDRQYPCFTDYQKYHYKLALLEQGIYIFKNSDISVDSGYDLDRGEVISREKIVQLSIAPNCKNELLLCGIWNRNIISHGGNWLLSWWLK